MSYSISVWLGMIGLVIEAVGVCIFTYDILAANREALHRINEVAKMRPVAFEVESMIGSDGPDAKFLFKGAKISEPQTENVEKILSKKRTWFKVGAGLLGIGISFQLAGLLCS